MSVRVKSSEYIHRNITGVIQAHHIPENTAAMTEFTRPHKIKLTQIPVWTAERLMSSHSSQKSS